MANYKILKQNKKGDKVNVIYYIPISDSVLQAKLVADSELDLGRHSGIIDGSIYEYSKDIEFSANLSTVAKRDIVENNYNTLVSSVNEKLAVIYEFFGYEGVIT